MKPGVPAGSGWFGRKEKETLNIPKELPNVSTLNVWLAKVATALTEASVYYDKAEVAWLMKATVSTATFEGLEDSGEHRFHGLDTMLATALQAVVTKGELGRTLSKKSVSALREGKLITGRQIVYMIVDHFKLNDSMAMVYSITDITAIKWRGDAPEQVSQFKSDWENILDNMDPNIDIGDEALKNILYEQIKQSKALDSEVKHYLRTPADRTYRFLIGAIDRFLELDRMDRNRKAQVLGQERDKDNKQALGAVTAASDARRSGGYPASTPPPCISFQTGECQRGKDCRYSHVRVSESELEDLKTRRNAFYQGIAEKGNAKAKPKETERGTRAFPLLRRALRDGIRPLSAGTGSLRESVIKGTLAHTSTYKN